MRKILALLFALVVVAALATPAQAGTQSVSSWAYRNGDPRDATWACADNGGPVGFDDDVDGFTCAIHIPDYIQFAVLVHWLNPLPAGTSVWSLGNEAVIDSTVYFTNYGCQSNFTSGYPWMVCFTSTVHMHDPQSHTGFNHCENGISDTRDGLVRYSGLSPTVGF